MGSLEKSKEATIFLKENKLLHSHSRESGNPGQEINYIRRESAVSKRLFS